MKKFYLEKARLKGKKKLSSISKNFIFIILKLMVMVDLAKC